MLNYKNNIEQSSSCYSFYNDTTLENWRKIETDACLKSWNVLKKDNVALETQPIGKSSGDPDDFSEYIMFSIVGISSKIVVLSKQLGKIMMKQDMEYQPGARLYFELKMGFLFEMVVI